MHNFTNTFKTKQMTRKEAMTKVLEENKAARDNPQLALKLALQLIAVSEQTAHEISLYREDILRLDRLWRQLQEKKDLRGEKWEHRHKVLAPKEQEKLGYKIN